MFQCHRGSRLRTRECWLLLFITSWSPVWPSLLHWELHFLAAATNTTGRVRTSQSLFIGPLALEYGTNGSERC